MYRGVYVFMKFNCPIFISLNMTGTLWNYFFVRMNTAGYFGQVLLNF